MTRIRINGFKNAEKACLLLGRFILKEGGLDLTFGFNPAILMTINVRLPTVAEIQGRLSAKLTAGNLAKKPAKF